MLSYIFIKLIYCIKVFFFLKYSLLMFLNLKIYIFCLRRNTIKNTSVKYLMNTENKITIKLLPTYLTKI